MVNAAHLLFKRHSSFYQKCYFMLFESEMTTFMTKHLSAGAVLLVKLLYTVHIDFKQTCLARFLSNCSSTRAVVDLKK